MMEKEEQKENRKQRGEGTVGAKSETAKREEEVLRFWQENKIFEQSLAKPSPQGEFVFYDGPPFATGLPHYGSLLSSIIKDVIPRYKTMRGFHVRRRWGWDCHGLPIENMVEKQLNLKSKKDIEAIGAGVFNRACRDSVLRYTHEWKDIIDRVGRWVEFDNAYKTMDATYMESVWWALKTLWEKGLLYEGRKVLPYCPRCETPLAKAEIAMDHSYVDVTEETVTVKFKVKDSEKHGLPENTFLLAWTTTPWTLPGNVALAVGENIDYVAFRREGSAEVYLVSFESFKKGGSGPGQFLVQPTGKDFLKGKDLIGLEYEPLFDIPAVKATGKKAWYVAPADFVSTEEGTGIVHTAVIYGEDDYELGLKLDLPAVPLLDASGHFNAAAPEFIRGEYFKKAENAIKDDLEKRGLLFSRVMFTHSYPHCHRCNTLLYYNAISSWFVAIEKIKERMVALNEEVNWFPEHLKHGRFLNTLKSAPDWTISRNRYWASPLPIWKCASCARVLLIGSVDELKKHTKKSGNRYLLMRHGEADSNTLGIISSNPDNPHHLTQKGREQVTKRAEQLKKEKIDFIIASPFVRARETAQIIADAIGLSRENVLSDERIREVKAGEFDGKSVEEFHAYFATPSEYFTKASPGGENYTDIKKRVGAFLYDLEERYNGKTILVITHDSPGWLLSAATQGVDTARLVAAPSGKDLFIANAEVKELPFVPLPHDETYTLDLHRPYIDAVALTCSCGTEMHRIPEVVDGWVESGSMPFAEYHYPFENKETFTARFPGDFIAEYIAQTRTWFYYMHTLAVALFGKPSFKNVVTTGNILGDDGNKMSKSKGNYTDPQLNIDKYGADALRYYLMTSVVMQAEDVQFADEELREVHNQAVNILRNVLQFYRTYGNNNGDKNEEKSSHPLDAWILARLSGLVREVTEYMEEYNTVRAGRPIRTFITDFSTWYIRRSRERLKSEDAADAGHAFATTRFVLNTLAKIAAPFMPFLAEEIYQEVKKDGDPHSVHLCDWPEAEFRILNLESGILEKMEEVRRIVSLGLEARAKLGIKVRQPLQKLKIKNQKSKIEDKEALLLLIKDEVNVKEVVFDASTTEEVGLDALITDELREEGMMRDFIRAIQDLRKRSGWTPNDRGTLTVHADEKMLELIKNNENHIKRATLLDSLVNVEGEAGEKIMIGESVVAVTLQKV